MVFDKFTALATATVLACSLCNAASAMGNDPDQRVLRVVGATYGGNCRAPANNAMADVGARCNGKKSCDYTVSYKVLGDPARGCRKDFQVKYYCGQSGPLQASAPGEAGYGTKVALICD